MKAEQVEIVRDSWGVPHIYADTEYGAIYGQGYAAAEDRLPTILKSYRKSIGRMAEAFGPNWIEHDKKMHLCHHEAAAKKHYKQLSASVQRSLRAYIAGVRHYMNEHPGLIPDWTLDLEPWHPLALGRAVSMEFVQRQWIADLAGRKPDDDTDRGSNAWAVTPRKSADGDVILHIDPHVPWADEWLWHESHLHGGDLHAYGFQNPGKPYQMLGHNEHIAWTLTAGGPDTADVFELQLNPENPRQYRYEGEWRDLEVETREIRVKTADGLKTVTHERLSSHHGGYVAEIRGDRAYVFADAYREQLDGTDLWCGINKARDLGDFLQALQSRKILPINVHYGDIYGNIYYQRAGRVPIRPAGVDPKRPIPGDTRATEWLGFHELPDYPQVLNPSSGWFQNCNISAASIMPGSPLTEDRYPHYLLHGRMNDEYLLCRDGLHPRGRRAYNLLSEMDRMTWEQAHEIAHDAYMQDADKVVARLASIWEEARDSHPHLGEAIDVLCGWNRQAKREEVGVTLFWMWFHKLKVNGEVDWPLLVCLLEEKPITAGQKGRMLAALEEAVGHLRTHFGTVQVRWEQFYRLRRGNETFAADGIEVFSLRIMSHATPGANGMYHPNFGQSCAALVSLKPGQVRSASALPFGNSEHPESPHYTDQGRLLFAENRLKDTGFSRERPKGRVTVIRKIDESGVVKDSEIG